MENTHKKSLYYPPGGILIWILIYVELFTFGMALIAMAYYGSLDKVVFHEARLQLNLLFGGTNTILLLTSGYFMAKSLSFIKENNRKASSYNLWLTILFGTLFLGLKTWEYNTKINAGLTLDSNLFYSFYWMLTLFHVIHVLVGLVILGFNLYSIKNAKTIVIEDMEAGAAFWHMCDLIWLLIFPMLYLYF